jgi:hypothetical protein
MAVPFRRDQGPSVPVEAIVSISGGSRGLQAPEEGRMREAFSPGPFAMGMMNPCKSEGTRGRSVPVEAIVSEFSGGSRGLQAPEEGRDKGGL